MFTVITDIKGHKFSSELSEFLISADKDTRVQLFYGYQVILDETFIPDSKGYIRIRELGTLFESYLIENLIGNFSYKLEQGTKSVTQEFTIQYCKAEIGLPALTFLDNSFLSLLMGEKITAMSRKEFLHVVCQKDTEIKAVADYSSGNTYESQSFTLEKITDTMKIVTVDVSPSRLQLDGKQLMSYTIEAGARSQTFQINRLDPQTRPNVVFTNSFGCQETVYCQGIFQLEGEFERSQGYIDGKYRTYHVNEKRTYKANTGILTPGMANWIEDLFRSTEIYLLEGETIGKEITITESKFVRSNAPDELPSLNFGYRYSQKNQNIMQLAVAGRIFDQSFDRTFN